MAPESEKNAWFGVESREHSLKQSTPVGTEELVEKSLRSLYKNDLRMSRGLGDILIKKGEGETYRDFEKWWNYFYWPCTVRVMECFRYCFTTIKVRGKIKIVKKSGVTMMGNGGRLQTTEIW